MEPPMRRTSLSFLLLLGSFQVAVLAWSDCSGAPNLHPICTKEPTFVKAVEHGKLYRVGDLEPQINLLQLSGTPYQMGYAHGSLLRDEIKDILSEVEQYLMNQVQPYISDLPDWLQEIVEKYGVEAALDATYAMTYPYIAEEWKQELEGLADASGLPYMDFVRIHMLPELIKAACSMYGAWGPASSGGTLYQLRALDWNTNGPFQKYPAVIVYHPEAPNGHNFTIVTWVGFVGAVTGFSSAPVGLSQKVWLRYNGTSSRMGIPFHFLLRDILQYDKDVSSALNRIYNAERTCSIFVGLGDPLHGFRAVEYAHDYVNVFDDTNYPPYDGHPLMKGVVYIDKHEQPSGDPCLGSLMTKYYGRIEPVITIQQITSVFQTGDTHIAIYDFANMWMYVANASPFVNGTFTPAYDRPFTRFDMNALFMETVE